MKNSILIKAAFAAFIFLYACGTNQTDYYKIKGQTMGTSYFINYEGKRPQDVQKQVDSLLILLNASLSTYDPNSLISQFNQNNSVEMDAFFADVYASSQEVFAETNGYFDPTVGPLIEAYGFGASTFENLDSQAVEKIMAKVDFNQIKNTNANTLTKESSEMTINFSAIAKGYGVDQVALLLDQLGMENYLVEIGGEVRVHGQNEQKRPWTVGIHLPQENTNKLFASASLSNRSIATSGNYRNYHEKDGRKYVHTINPKTGFPEINTLLSASVISNSCMRSDGLATAFMAMGKDKTIECSKSLNDIGIYLIYLNDDNQLATYKSPGYETTFSIY